MNRSTRIFVGFLVPVFTLLLGWQLGERTATERYKNTEQHLIEMLQGVSQSGATIGDPKTDVNIELLWTTWRLLQRHYLRVNEMNAQTMVEGAVSGMVDSLGDPYTLFMTAKENDEFMNGLDGNLEGIGAELETTDDGIRVVRLIESSPAEQSGLLPEDLITKVNGEDIVGLDLQDVIGKIRGPKGTSVTLDVMRGTDTLSFTIVRDTIHIASAEYETKTTPKGTIGLLTINQFGGETVAEVRSLLSSIRPGSIKGLVIDLRYNGGGYLDGAVELTSMFVRQGTVVTVAGRDSRQDYAVTGKTLLPDLPLAVLINGGSASASEIFAGALQDHGRAVIVGTQSFGKGTVQEVIDLPGGSALRVTTASWLTPKGTDLGKHGVTPDVVIDRTPEEYKAKLDPQLDAAIQQVLE